MKTFDLNPAFADAEADLDVADYVDAEQPQQALAKRLDNMLSVVPLEVHVEQCVRWERNLTNEQEMLAAEIGRLKQKKISVDNRREALRQYLRNLLLVNGRPRIRTPLGTPGIQAGREKIVFDDDENMRDHVKRWPASIVAKAVTYPPPKVSKEVLKRDFGDQLVGLPGVSVEVGEDTLVIHR